MLARRLDQLHTTLEALGDRLRRAVADAIAESLGGWIRDAVLTTLERLAGNTSDLEPRRLPSEHRWDEPRRMIRRDDVREETIWPETFEPADEEESYDEPERFDERSPTPAQPSSDRLALSLAAGLHAAAWWMRRAVKERPLLSMAGVAFLVGLAVLAAPVLTTSAFGLITSAGQLEALTNATGFGRSFRSNFGSA
jgi:hypothetical protein